MKSMNFGYALVSITLISLISVGLSGLLISKYKNSKDMIIWIVAIAAGVLIGDAFLHLIPESIEILGDTQLVGALVLIGIIFFYIFEKLIFWRHCHDTSDDHVHPFAYTNLFGDILHNFIDGILIGASFIVSVPLGINTSIAVGLHEIPQEFSDMGVLIHAGFKKKKAILLNLLTALSALLGLILVYMIGINNTHYVNYLLPITAGGFIYISVSDLLPELKHHEEWKKSTLQLVFFLVGIFISVSMLYLEI